MNPKPRGDPQSLRVAPGSGSTRTPRAKAWHPVLAMNASCAEPRWLNLCGGPAGPSVFVTGSQAWQRLMGGGGGLTACSPRSAEMKGV